MAIGRNFIILNREEGAFCDTGATGYCKIEMKPDKTKIRVFVQGLKRVEDNYYIYLLSLDRDLIHAKLGEIKVSQEGGEFECEVDSSDVGGTGVDISKFNIITICKSDGNTFSFPLAGYNNILKNNAWINLLIKKLHRNDTEEHGISNVQEEQNIGSFKTAAFEAHAEEESIKQETIDYNKFNAIRKGTMDDVNKIMNELSGVSEFNPFGKSKLKYKWWKVNDVKVIENIFEYSNASEHVFRHPLLKKILKDSNYFIFGVVSDQNNKIKYISYGFPAKYSNKDQFYVGGFSNFYPDDGNDRKSGESGYWIVHIRVDNDNIVITV